MNWYLVRLTGKHNDYSRCQWGSEYHIHRLMPVNGRSSSSYIPRGTSNTSCSHFVKENGIVWPRCSASLDGPLPVYKKKGSPASYLSRILSKSRCEKKRPRLNQRCGLWPVRRSKRWRRSSSINLVAHFLFTVSEWLHHGLRNLGILWDRDIVNG